MNTHSFTYIITYRHSLSRLNNLKKVLDWINSFSGVDVILVEQDTHSKISHINLNCRKVFIKTDKPFNKAWGYNVGTKLAKTNLIGFGDYNVVMEPNKFIQSIKMLDRHDMVNPNKYKIELQPSESNSSIGDICSISRTGIEVGLCNGITFFKRESISKIGGWNEEFPGEKMDMLYDSQSFKVKNLLDYIELDNSFISLYEGVTSIDTILEKKNLETVNRFIKLSKDDLIRTINNGLQKVGMKNKYDTF